MKRIFLGILAIFPVFFMGCDLKYLSETEFYDSETTQKTVLSPIEDGNAVYVSAAYGDDTNDGLTYATPVATIGVGITTAQTEGRIRVMVSAGEYPEIVTPVEGISLYGGYNTDFTIRNNLDRNNPDYRTRIFQTTDGNQGMMVCNSLTSLTVIDGFTIIGDTAAPYSTAITLGYVSGTASPTIQNNTIVGGTAPDSCGIFIVDGDPIIRNNVIRGGGGTINSFGIHAIANTDPIIEYNDIDGRGNNSTAETYGIHLDGTFAIIRNNQRIIGGQSAFRSIGISCVNTGGSNPNISDNGLIHGGSSTAESVGIYCDGSNPVISNNIIHAGLSTADNKGIILRNSSLPAIINNTIDFFTANGIGVYQEDIGSVPVSLNNNDFLTDIVNPAFYVDEIAGPVVYIDIGVVNALPFSTVDNDTH